MESSLSLWYNSESEVKDMWWMINAAGERVFTVESEEEAKARLDDWYVDYIYVGQNVYFMEGLKMANKEKIESLKADANNAKNKLMEIAEKLYQEKAIREAKSLETIIAKLEAWQNK